MKMSDEIVSVQVHFHNQYYFGSLTFISWNLYQYQHLARNKDGLFQDEKDKPKITKKQNYVVFRHKPKEKSRSKSKDEKERIQIESDSSDEETQSFLHRSTKESSFLNRFLKTSENLEEKGPVLFQKSPTKDNGFQFRRLNIKGMSLSKLNNVIFITFSIQTDFQICRYEPNKELVELKSKPKRKRKKPKTEGMHFNKT